MYKSSLTIVFLGSVVLFACKQKKTPPPTEQPVNLYTVSSQQVVYYDRYPATTVALSQVNLLPQVQGYITAIDFKEGTHVHKGQKLYEIDKRMYEANYKAAQDNMQVQKGNLTQSQQDADRYSYLNANKAVAKQLYDHAVIALQNSKNQYQAATESLRTARINLAFSEIDAPFDGTIGFSQVKLGDLVSVGQTVLNTISTDDPMAVDFLINEKQLTYFEDLQAGKDKDVDSLFTLQLPNGSYYPMPGKLSVIDRAVNAQTGSVRIRVVFPNAKYYLRAGMSCVMRVHNQDAKPQMVIPYKAVVEQMGEYFVYVAKDTAMAPPTDTASGGKHHAATKQGLYALQQKVELGQVVGPNVIVKSGINDGEKIVVDGVQALHDGSAITTANKVAPAQPGRR